LTNLYFDNIDVVRLVFRAIMAKLPLYAKLFDGMVYHANRTFRTAYSHKLSAPAHPLLPDPFIPLTPRSFLAFLVTCPLSLFPVDLAGDALLI
jgi:hypothetical protein